MDRERLKLIYKNLRSLLNALEAEIYSDKESYFSLDENVSIEDDDGYTD